MAGALRKTMVYLGLAEDDDRYDATTDYEDYDEEPAQAERRTPARTAPPRSPRCRSDPGRPGGPRAEVGPLNRITTIHPRTYNEAKTIGRPSATGPP